MWLPLPLASRLTFFGSAWNTGAVWLFPIARLSPGVDPTKIENQMTAFRRSMERDRPRGDTTITLEIHSILPSRARSLSPEAKIAALLGGVSLLVLLVACTNAANLMLARAVRREREIAIRVALGVSRWRLIRQLIVDALLLSTLGAVAAIGIAALGSAIMRRVLLQGLVWDGSLVDARTIAFIAIATLVAALLTSVIPAWMVLHRVNVAHAIGNASARQAGRSQRSVAISSLVIAQTVLSAVLLIGALLFVRSLQNVRHVPVGMDVDHIVVASIDPKRTHANDAAGDALFTELAAQAANLPGVKSTAITEGIPYLYNQVRRIAAPSVSPDLDWIQNGVAMQAVTPNYFATMGTRIERGRSFDASEDRVDGEPVAIVNSSLANGLWPGVDAIGKCIQVAPKEPEKSACRRIVGIVEDLRPIVTNADPHETSAVYVPLSQATHVLYARVVIVRASNDATDLPRELLNLAHGGNFVLPVADVWTMSSKLEPQLRPWKLGATMFGVFGVLAFLLAALGTYSVIAYSVAQRTQEMGVRIALGARTMDILTLIGRQGATLGIFGVAIALVVAAMLAPFVQPLLFNTSGRSVTVYATVGLSMVMVAVVASLIPAWRGARVDPLAAIRAE
jgi:predicted permease